VSLGMTFFFICSLQLIHGSVTFFSLFCTQLDLQDMNIARFYQQFHPKDIVSFC